MSDRIDVDLIVKAVAQGFEKLEGDLGGADDKAEQIRKTTNQLNKAMLDASNAAKKLADAEKALAANTDPTKQQKLATEVAKARVELDRVDDSVKKYSDELKHLNATTENTKSRGQQISAAFSTIANGIAKGTAAAVAFGVTFNKIMDFGEQGAQLDYAREKFDRLSESIGATGEVMLGDLRDATKGLVSDAQLVQSAGDFMSLGLAKTSDEVIRLTKVAGALGMDMNQLVLTLTNQTTMRFDALGVSVDGFDEKVKALEATGMSANEAFGEAFLQQAEEQLERVGEQADSSVAAFKRLDTAFANITDEIKRGLAPALANAAMALELMLTWDEKVRHSLNEHQDTMKFVARSYDEYINELRRAAKVAGYQIDAEGNLISVYEDELQRIETVIQANYALSEADYEVERSKTAAAASTARWTAQAEKATAASDEEAESAKALDEAIRGVTLAFGDLTNAELANAAYKQINQAWEDGIITADQYKAMMMEVAFSLGEETAATVEANLKLFELQQQYEAGLITLDQFIDATKEFSAELNGIPKHVQVLIDVKMDSDAALAAIKSGGIYNPYGSIDQRAGGGPVSAGVPYIVGENGPELFVPSGSGSIVPNVTNNFNMTVNTNAPSSTVVSDFNLMRSLAGV